jgi:hypothetical protein
MLLYAYTPTPDLDPKSLGLGWGTHKSDPDLNPLGPDPPEDLKMPSGRAGPTHTLPKT